MYKNIKTFSILCLILIMYPGYANEGLPPLLPANTLEKNSEIDDLLTSEKPSYALEVAYLTSKSIIQVDDLAGLSAQFTIYSDNFDWVFSVQNLRVTLSEALDEDELDSSDQGDISIFDFGVGLQMESLLIRNFFSSSSFKEEFSVLALYSSADADNVNQSLSGFGFMANYALVYHLSHSWALKAKMSYNIRSLEASSVTEGQGDVEVTASWLSASLGLAVSF